MFPGRRPAVVADPRVSTERRGYSSNRDELEDAKRQWLGETAEVQAEIQAQIEQEKAAEQAERERLEAADRERQRRWSRRRGELQTRIDFAESHLNAGDDAFASGDIDVIATAIGRRDAAQAMRDYFQQLLDEHSGIRPAQYTGPSSVDDDGA